ncbi:protein serine/threonine phosphatase 2C [Ascodesmis nigricans]|uniref:Protein serine/threonine phosphatase 2C n=1 Tax=Ascodesmis nigricans TaxID=341454 RepID=A0A4S2MPS8_9PEZI|nr:protein serine/threonine phosphatase 2C [Ascodesmis nigricans]
MMTPYQRAWGLRDSYSFISRYLSRRQTLCAEVGLRGSRLQKPPIYQQRRWFRDYFTAVLPGSSLHPDPQLRKGKLSSTDRETTTVRIPLRSAKHHFGVSTSRGTRPYNEDHSQAGVIDIPPFSSPPENAPKEDAAAPMSDVGASVFYYGVFDGHGGDTASLYLKDNLHTYIEQTSRLFNPTSTPVPISPTNASLPEALKAHHKDRQKLQKDLLHDWKSTVGGYWRRVKIDFGLTGSKCNSSGSPTIPSVLMYSLLKLDLDFITNSRPFYLPPTVEGEEPTLLSGDPKGVTTFKGGSTSTIILISPSTPHHPYWHPEQTSTLITCHLGDTRAILCRTSDGTAHPLTLPHSPSSPTESARLRRYTHAFNHDSFGEERFGFLANTRSVGDASQKRLGVSAEPDISSLVLHPSEYSFLVLVTDGVSGVLGDQEICDIVKEEDTPEKAAREITEFVEEVGEMGDNATVLVVRLGGWEKRGAEDGGERTRRLRMWRREEAGERYGRGRMN